MFSAFPEAGAVWMSFEPRLLRTFFSGRLVYLHSVGRKTICMTKIRYYLQHDGLLNTYTRRTSTFRENEKNTHFRAVEVGLRACSLLCSDSLRNFLYANLFSTFDGAP